MRQSVFSLCRISKNRCAGVRPAKFGLELEGETLCAKIKLDRFAFFAAFPDSFEPLFARLALARLIPDESFGVAGFDPVADVEISVGFTIFGNKNFGDGFFGVVVDLKRVILTEGDR
jgi:hypothetical protein